MGRIDNKKLRKAKMAYEGGVKINPETAGERAVNYKKEENLLTTMVNYVL